MKIITIVQARMGSTRLPGKMLLPLGSKPVIAHVIDRAKMSKLSPDVILATSEAADSDPLAAWAKENNVPCYRGSENDVLDRFYQAAEQAEADVVVRVTGDCPLLDPNVVDLVIQSFIDGDYDYVSNTQPPTFPDGLDVEVVSFTALERAWKSAKLTSEREHVMPYIWKQPGLFRLGTVKNSIDLSTERWTLDTEEDYNFLFHVIEACNVTGKFFGMKEVLAIVQAHPKWRNLNAMHKRNEGYKKSVTED